MSNQPLTFTESSIQFTLDPKADIQLTEHEKQQDHSRFPGVDYRFKFETNEVKVHLWLEIKRWSDNPEDYEQKTIEGQTETFIQSLRNKFAGTTAYLAWTGQFELLDVTCVFLLEPPHGFDSALLGSRYQTMTTKLNGFRFDPDGTWNKQIKFVVVTLDQWNKIYPWFAGEPV
jgi:hypothetical protein